MSHQYFSSGTEHLDRLRAGDRGALDAYFHERIAEYNHAYITEEFLTFGIFDDMAPLEPAVAFDLLPGAVEIALKWRDGILLELAVLLLADLARLSRTTEMPDELEEWWSRLRAAVDEWLESELRDPSAMRIEWDSLRRHYRRT